MSTILDISESIKDAGATRYGEPPYGHAELSSLRTLAKKEGLDLEECILLLEQADIVFKNHKQTILEIARANRLTPKQLYEIIQPAKVQRPGGSGSVFPDSPPPGFGNKKLGKIYEEFGLHVPSILKALSGRGIKVDPALTIKEIARKNKLEPIALFKIIRDAAER